MITFVQKTLSHDEFLASIGYSVRRKSGDWELYGPAGLVTDEAEIATVQAQIDAYDPLPAERQRLASLVDVAAGEARQRYITTVPGQEITYELKRLQAEAHAAAGYPADLSPYPMIAAEQAARGGTAQAASDYILATSGAWVQLAANIEQIRRGAKVALDKASTGLEDIAGTAITGLEAV